MQGMPEWEVVSRIATAMGYPMHYDSAAEIMDEIARVTPTFEGVSFDRLDEQGSIQWPCNDEHRKARRSCIWTSSRAARAASC